MLSWTNLGWMLYSLDIILFRILVWVLILTTARLENFSEVETVHNHSVCGRPQWLRVLVSFLESLGDDKDYSTLISVHYFQYFDLSVLLPLYVGCRLRWNTEYCVENILCVEVKLSSVNVNRMVCLSGTFLPVIAYRKLLRSPHRWWLPLVCSILLYCVCW